MGEQAPKHALHQEIALWATSGTSFEYGHLRTDEGYGTSWRLEVGICSAILDISPDTGVLFVGSKFERDAYLFDRTQASQPGVTPPKEPFVYSTYESFAALLADNRLPGGAGPLFWRRAKDHERLVTDLVFTNRTTIIFAIDPSESVEYALAITLMSRWAIDFFKRRGARFRILTMSDQPPNPTVGRMLGIYRRDMPELRPRVFSLNGNGLTKLSTCKSHDIGTDANMLVTNAIQTIEQCRLEHPNEALAVIWHPAVGPDRAPSEEWRSYSMSPEFRPEVFHNPQPGVHFFLIEDATIPVSRLEGFDQVHIVTRTHAERTELKPRPNHTFQFSTARTELSRPERHEQLSWAQWASCDPENIHIYTETGVATFLRGGPDLRRARFKTRDASMLATMVCQYKDWDIRPQTVLPCLWGDTVWAKVVLGRLCLQKIISCAEVTGRQSLVSALPDCNRSMLLKLIPVLGGDFRLAHFVCLPTNDATVLMSKLQGAVMTFFERHRQLFDFCPRGDFGDLFQQCFGTEKPVAMIGQVWLRISLFRQFSARIRLLSHLEQIRLRRGSEYRHDTVARSQVSVNWQNGQHAIETMNEILLIVHQHGISFPPGIADDDGDVHSEEACRALQRDLLTAFSHQLTLIRRQGDGLSMADVSTWTGFHHGNSMAGEAMKAALSAAEDDCCWGVYTSSSETAGGNRLVHDWNFIDSSVLEEWVQDHCADQTLEEALTSLTYPRLDFVVR